MPNKLNVLISAYACEPGKGSEPEVGWQWALQMARFHNVTVLTRRNNQRAIEEGLRALKTEEPRPRFVFHDGPGWQLRAKRLLRAVQLYYVLWQRSANRLVAALHKEQGFHLLHHVTFAAFRYPTVIWGHGVPSIWGPIGGIENVPAELLPWKNPLSLLSEGGRNIHNRLHIGASPAFRRRLKESTVILASTYEMQRAVARHGYTAELLPTIGLRTSSFPFTTRKSHHGPLRLLFVGNFLSHKGIDLGMKALARSGKDASLTLVGDGPLLGNAQHLAKQLGLGERVSFAGRLPRSRVLEMYREFDVFLFPALHDTGGYAVIEAMLNQLPVICLDTGGPAVSVQSGCGAKIPLGSRDEIVEHLANAISHYDSHREEALRHGRHAREVVIAEYDWDRKGLKMDEIYQRACGRTGEGHH